MMSPLPFRVPIDVIDDAVETVIHSQGKFDISLPTGDPFYDPWELKEEYKGGAWEIIWNSLPTVFGQARVISLDSPSCYTQHADIDDRYHLNLFGDQSYLIDLENKHMFKLEKDGVWYEMNAGILHTAINIGEHKRLQLVVRKLLKRNVLKSPKAVSITVGGENPRYHFDNVLSSWLNHASKIGTITNFKREELKIDFDVEDSIIDELTKIIPNDFKLEVEK